MTAPATVTPIRPGTCVRCGVGIDRVKLAALVAAIGAKEGRPLTWSDAMAMRGAAAALRDTCLFCAESEQDQ